MTPQLTVSQLQALKAYAQADPAASAFIAAGNDTDLAAWFNAVEGSFTVWKKTVPTLDVGKTINYIAVEAMTDANRNRITTFYAMNPGSFDPARSDVRSYWDNTFSGALGGQGQASRDALMALWRRLATRAESALANTAGGNGANATPAALTAEGSISLSEVAQVRTS